MTDRFVHYLEHLVLYSLIIWQIILGLWLIIRWIVKNIKFHRSPSINVGELSNRVDSSPIVELNKNKDLGPIEVKVKKNIFIDEADDSDISNDEEVKGKVKTQKDKLKSLRGR